MFDLCINKLIMMMTHCDDDSLSLMAVGQLGLQFSLVLISEIALFDDTFVNGHETVFCASSLN